MPQATSDLMSKIFNSKRKACTEHTAMWLDVTEKEVGLCGWGIELKPYGVACRVLSGVGPTFRNPIRLKSIYVL